MRIYMCIDRIKKNTPQLLFDTFPWRHWQRLRPDAIALWQGDKAISWQQLSHDIDSECAQLSLYQGETFALAGDKDYRTLIKMLAIWQLGKSSLLINPDFSPSFTHELITKIGIDQHLQDLPKNPSFCFPRPALPCPALLYSVKKTAYDPLRPLTMTLTSGSTGFPKAIVHNACQHIASALGLFSRISFKPKDVWLLSLPLYHISGLAIIWRWLVKGGVLKLTQTRGMHFFTAFEKVTHASLVPSQLFDLLENSQDSLKSLKTVLLGGTKIPLSLALKAEQKGIETWCGYGMTEMASTITVKRADSVFSVGQILPFRQIRITPLGTIEVKGETLALGERRKGALFAFNERVWFETKDCGFWLKEKEELVITGRADNVFQSGGENVQPEMLETLLSKYEGVEAVLIIPVADKRWGNVPVALVKGSIDKKRFLVWARKELVNYLQPKAVFFIPEVFLSQGIKLPRAKLAKWGQAQWDFYQVKVQSKKKACVLSTRNN